MKHSHTHHHEGCAYCACNSPITKVLQNEGFLTTEKLDALVRDLPPFQQPAQENLVISGGIIRPLINGTMDTVEAIGIYGGKVVTTGAYADVINYMHSQGYAFQEKQLSTGQTLLPGLIEPHIHIALSALLKDWLDLTAFDGQVLKSNYNLLTITQSIQDYIQKNPDESMVLGQGLDPAFMPFMPTGDPGYNMNNLQEINYTVLDNITSTIPLLILSASGHTMYLNSPALEAVYNHDANLQSAYPQGWTQYRDATQGQLQELAGMNPAVSLILAKKWPSMALHFPGNLSSFFLEASSRGVTFMYDAAMSSFYEVLLLRYLPGIKKTVRIGAAKLCTDQKEVDALKQHTPLQDYQDVYYGNVKLVSDGSNQGLTGYQAEPYLCAPADNYGLFNFLDNAQQTRPQEPTEVYKNLVKGVIAKGWPLMIHANGDKAVEFALDVYSQYAKPEDKLRHRIEHCSLLTTDQIQTMKQLGVSPSFLIGHVGYWGYAFQKAIFGEKSEYLDLCKSAADQDIRITLHSDHTVSPVGPLRMMEQSITRIMEADPHTAVLNAAERLSPEQALLAVTYDAAWQCNADQWVGALAPGLFADFVILAQDPLSMNSDNAYMAMRNIPVVATYQDGRQMWPATGEKVQGIKIDLEAAQAGSQVAQA